MQKAAKKIIISLILLVAFAAGGIGVYFYAFTPSNDFVYGEESLSGDFSDVGEYCIEDDFRKVGFTNSEYRSLSIENSGVYTGEYGDYFNGVVPLKNVENKAGEAGNGKIIYKIPLSYKNFFVNLYSLNIQLEYKIKSSDNQCSLGIGYGYNGVDFFEDSSDLSAADYNQTVFRTVDLSYALNETLNPEIIEYEYFYICVNINHKSKENVCVGDAGINLYSVKITGYNKFSASFGASIRETDNELYKNKYGDFSYKFFVSKDLVNELNRKYPSNDYSIYYFGLLMPFDYIESYGDLSLDNLIFSGNNVYVGEEKEESSIVYQKTIFLSDKRNNKALEYTNKNGTVYYCYRTALGRIKTKNLDRDFVAKGMITVNKKSGETVCRALTDYKNGNVKNCARSVAFIAQSAIKDDPSLSLMLNKIFLDNLYSREEGCLGGYYINKFYIDGDYNIVYAEKVFAESKQTIGEEIVLSNEEKASSVLGYVLKEEPILYGGKTVYQSKLSDIILASDKTVLTLYYVAD